jgi:hypothetical protein
MRHATVLANLLAAAAALSAKEQESWTPGQEVETQTGQIKGHEAVWPPGSGVSEYLGIPYAKVPVGPLRFAPPVLNKSNATFVADKYVRMTISELVSNGELTLDRQSKSFDPNRGDTNMENFK